MFKKGKILAVQTAMLLTAVSVVHAVSFKAEVPFAFVVGRQTLPAGSYVVEALTARATANATAVVVIKTTDHRIYHAVVTLLKPERPRGSRLLFKQFKGQEYLSWVCVAGDSMARQLSTPADSASVEAMVIREVRLVSLR